LFDAGAAQWGTDESKFNAILCTRSFPHLRQVFKYYEEISGEDISAAIDSEFTGDVQAGLLAIGNIKSRRTFVFLKIFSTSHMILRYSIHIANLYYEYEY
jgi:hypothetical protein